MKVIIVDIDNIFVENMHIYICYVILLMWNKKKFMLNVCQNQQLHVWDTFSACGQTPHPYILHQNTDSSSPKNENETTFTTCFTEFQLSVLTW